VHRIALALALAGCVTTEGIVKQEQTPLVWLAAGTAGDLVVIGAIAKEGEGLTTGASIATALAFTAVDVFVGCLLGACSSLKLW
jgi:hypothetical protein